MTPRSKIRALLATVDSSSDDDTNKSPSKAKSQRRIPTQKIAQPFRDAESEDDDEESDVDVRPRGRLAAGMLATNTTRKSLEHESKDNEDVQMGEASVQNDSTLLNTAAEVEDDDDDLPVVPRRLQRRTKAATPTPDDGASRSTSPGLFVSSPIRPSPSKSVQNNSASEDDLPSLKSDRFKALVERKRQERLAREAEEEARKTERRAQQEKARFRTGAVAI
jgi:mediator of replication checkpoint protein 1